MGIRVNAISPGNIIFPGSTWEAKLAHNREAVQAMLNHEVPMQRFGAPEEIGSVAAFLASRRAGFVTGANWVVDGGQTRNG
jgi:3-oxoacyl-[acyl-carrier protein] reductase